MKRQLGRATCVLAAAAILAVAGGEAADAAQGRRAETSLLGITLLKSSYRDVLKRFGRPDEIQAGGPYLPSEGAPTARAAAAPTMGGKMGGMMGGSGGMMGPGLPGMGGPGGPSGGGGKRAISKNGFPGRSGTGAAGPAAAGGYPGMGPGGPRSSGYPGMGGPGGLPGFGGPPGMPGYPGMGGSAGMPGMGADNGPMPGMGGPGAAPGAEAGEQPEYEATWWYHDRTNGLHKSFLFNKDGRVIQIQEYGYDKHHMGSKTRLGVGLGSSLNTVLRNYGWSNDGANEGRNIIMRYGGEDKIAFQLVNNVVVGITVAVVKDVAPAEAP